MAGVGRNSRARLSSHAQCVTPVAAVSLAFATAFVLSVEGAFWATMSELAGEHGGAAGGVMNMGSNVADLFLPR